jgi:hypothetical protein
MMFRTGEVVCVERRRFERVYALPEQALAPELLGPPPAEADAIRRHPGTLYVVAAGNGGADVDAASYVPCTIPATNLVCVGASDNRDAPAPYSNHGKVGVDLFAPGTGIVTPSNTGGYLASNGTSFSAPIVAAAVALYRGATPSATAAEIKQAILADVDVLPAFTGRSVTGGRLTTGRLTGAAESARYAFTSMTSPAGLVSPAIGVTGPRAAGDYSVVLGLGMEDGGEIWALADKPVTLGGVTVTTDDAGDAVFPLGSRPGLDGTALAPRMELGDGRYVLTVQTYRDGAPVGRTYAAPLLVGSAVPVPGTPGGTTPGGNTNPGTTTPGTTTARPGGSATTPGATTPGTTAARPGTNATTPGTSATTPGATMPGGSGAATTSPPAGSGTSMTPGATPGNSAPAPAQRR